MMKLTAATLALVVGSTTAFAPAASSSNARNAVAPLNAERSVSMPFMNRQPLLDGSMAGDVGFDPLGLSNIDDVGIDLYWLREAELKHCRLAMMAVAGFLQVEIFGPAPGNEMCDNPNQIAAFWQFWNAHPQYIGFGFIMVGFIEMFTGIATTTGRESGMREPGEFGLDPLQFKKNPEGYKKLQLHEVKNGRLAMFAAAGEIMQGWTTDEGALGNLYHSIHDNAF